MLSSGRPGIDDVFYLVDGILYLQLGKETYERTGLQGKPIRDAGRKHLRGRFLIEINLRAPSMVHGKKGFERVVWAFKEVLNHSVTWLFYDYQSQGGGVSHHPASSPTTTTEEAPIAVHHPLHFVVSPTITRFEGVKVPPLTTSAADPKDPDWALETHEWLGMVALQSPRVQASDEIDPYLCRYRVPDAEKAETYDLVSVEWKGFIPSEWVRDLFVRLCKMHKAFAGPRGWFSLSGYAFPTEAVGGQTGWTTLRLAHDESDAEREEKTRSYVLWEMQG